MTQQEDTAACGSENLRNMFWGLHTWLLSRFSFLRSTPTPCMASTDVSMVWWWAMSGQRYNQNPLVWLVEFLSPIHQLGTKPGQCQTWTVPGDGEQCSAVTWEAEMLSSFRLRCFAAKHSRSEHSAGAWVCLSLMWLLVLAFLSHDPGWRPVFHQISSCNVPLFITPTNTAAALAFH